MDNIPEREQPKPERTVKLGEEFQLFDPKHVHIRNYDRFSLFDYKFLLNIEDDFQLPFGVYAADIEEGIENKKGDYLLPFGPRDDGYHIDPEDFNIETRREKLKRLQEELQKPLDLTKNPLWLLIDTNEEELTKLGLNKYKGDNYEFPYKMLDLLKRLRITLKTPGGSFEAMPLPDYKRSGEVIFASFYPADFGPLAANRENFSEPGEGLNLGLPSDLEKLAQIRARFVLAEEEPRAVVSQT